MLPLQKSEIIARLQAGILRMQGFRQSTNTSVDAGLGIIKSAFPNESFPIGAVHEFIASKKEDASSTSGFIAGLLSSLIGSGTTLWISASRTLFPPALKSFGLEPDHFIFLDLQREKDVLWSMNEALKCEALAAVIAEMHSLDFIASRKLQLAVEQSGVTGFVIRNSFKSTEASACVSRWRITSLPSEPIDELPGIGFPRWQVELLKIRNGRPGAWITQCINGKFVTIADHLNSDIQPTVSPIKKAG